MKKCPNCKKVVPDTAKQCPYCAHVFGYQKIVPKKSNSQGVFYSVLAICLLLSPLTFQFFIGGGQSAVANVGEDIVEVERDQEEVVTSYASAQQFIDDNPEYEYYLDPVYKVQNELTELAKENNGTVTLTSCKVYIAKSNNVFFYPTYEVKFENNNVMNYYLEFDASRRTANLMVELKESNIKDFQSSTLETDDKALIQQFIAVTSDEDIEILLDKLDVEYNNQEESFIARQGTIGNYGINARVTENDILAKVELSESNESYYRIIQVQVTAKKIFNK